MSKLEAPVQRFLLAANGKCPLFIQQYKDLRNHFIGNPRGSVVVKALYYKPEGRWFDTQ
jgi:hypothetical protein